MDRIINYSEIRDVSTYLKEQIVLLKEKELKLKNDIIKISESYKGDDSKNIVNKYLEKEKFLTFYIEVIEAYNYYFEWISMSYKECHKNALSNLDSSSANKLDVISTLSIDNIDSAGDLNV